MNIKHLCLIVGLLGLPVAYANAGEITINVPVELTNLPAANSEITLFCRVGVGDAGASPGYSGANAIGMGSLRFQVDENFNGTKQIPIRAHPGRNLDVATHYTCELLSSGALILGIGRRIVRGPIPR